MIRNSIIYRRLWYIKRRNSKRLYFYFRLLSIVIILVLMAFYAKNYSVPYVIANTEQNIKYMIEVEAQNSILELMKDEKNMGLSSTDSEKAAELAWIVSSRLEERLDSLNTEGVQLPLGAMFGNTMLAQVGPSICFHSRLLEEIKCQVSSEASNLDGNKAKHGIYISVHTKVGIKILLKERVLEIETSLLIPEDMFVRREI